MRSAQRRSLIATAGAAVCAGLAAAASCALPSYSVDDSLAPDGGTPTGVGGSAGASPTGGGGTSQGGSLPNVGGMLGECGPDGSYDDMVAVPGGYCIDQLEVSWEQYLDWINNILWGSPVPSQLDELAGCDDNWQDYPSFVGPDGQCTMGLLQASGAFPVVCVDWCDAAAYCIAMGKHLCGKRGGGSNAFDAFADPTRSEWHNACTSGGRHTYPYGNDYDANICTTKESGATSADAVGDNQNCASTEADYEGVRNLSGNVAEWEDSCNGSAPDSDCRVRGGSYDSQQDRATCADDTFEDRFAHKQMVGFRCCWQPDDGEPLTDAGAR